MKSTIQVDLHEQAMKCCVCGELKEIPRRMLRDQQALLELADDVAVDHCECARDPERPEMARLSREFRKRIEREERRTAERQRAA